MVSEKESCQNKSRKRFRELSGCDILGVDEKSAEHIDAAIVGDLDFKEDAKFEGDQAVISDFAKSAKYSLSQERQYLFSARDDLMQVVRDNQVVVVVGETGFGMSTQLTQFLHEDRYTSTGLVGCIQPRRAAAMCVAKRVSKEMETELGDLVGFEDLTGPKTVIKYMTDVELLREKLKDLDLNKYRVIVIDEAHYYESRSLSMTNFLFGILQKVVARRRDIKLIVVTSVTHKNAQKFSSFFGHVPIFYIPAARITLLPSNKPYKEEEYSAMEEEEIETLKTQITEAEIKIDEAERKTIDKEKRRLKQPQAISMPGSKLQGSISTILRLKIFGL